MAKGKKGMVIKGVSEHKHKSKKRTKKSRTKKSHK